MHYAHPGSLSYELELYEHFNFSQVSYDKFVGKMQHAAKYFNIIFFNFKSENHHGVKSNNTWCFR